MADGVSGHVFRNWAETHSCQPELYFEPKSVAELRQILANARVNKKKVKVVGNRHSPSDIACTDDYMISLKHINKILEIDDEKKTAKVEGGILLADLNEALDQNGLALSVLGSVSDVSLAGTISTGTHGTGKAYGPINSYVLELGLLCADGNIRTLTAADADPDTFNAARLGLGALGVIIWVKIQCEPAFRLHQVQYGVKLQDVLENIDVHLSASDHFRFMWFPHTDGCVAYHSTRSTKSISRNDSWFWDFFVGYIVLEFLYWLSTYISSIVPWISRTFYRLQCSRRELVDRSDRVFNFNCLFKQYVMEWAVPREQTALVLWQLKAWTDENFYAHFPVEVRFARRDDALLSLAHGTDVCYVNIIMYRPYGKDVDFERYWTTFQDIMLKAGGRPHWAKDFKVTRDQLRTMYPQFDRFVEIRNQLDPERMFTNNNLKRLFGD